MNGYTSKDASKYPGLSETAYACFRGPFCKNSEGATIPERRDPVVVDRWSGPWDKWYRIGTGEYTARLLVPNTLGDWQDPIASSPLHRQWVLISLIEPIHSFRLFIDSGLYTGWVEHDMNGSLPDWYLRQKVRQAEPTEPRGFHIDKLSSFKWLGLPGNNPVDFLGEGVSNA